MGHCFRIPHRLPHDLTWSFHRTVFLFHFEVELARRRTPGHGHHILPLSAVRIAAVPRSVSALYLKIMVRLLEPRPSFSDPFYRLQLG